MNQKKVILALLIGAVVLDQLLKSALGTPAAHPTSTSFTLWNLIVVVGLGAAAFFLGWRRDKPITFAALASIVAGSASNGFDRLVRGHAIVWFQGFGNTSFNLADIVLSTGVFLGFIGIVRSLWKLIFRSRAVSND